MLGIGDYFWRLIPANPILLRVVQSGGKRRRDLIIRSAYLGLLVLVVLFSLFNLSDMGLDKLAGTSALLFQRMSYLQLGLVALLAPIFTAGAITQEKDSQTYDILLSTPLTNGQIVLGSLLSRLFFVVALLISGIPIFSITQIFGGVAVGSITMSFLIAAATAFVTGALAMAIATFKVGTRRTIFSFYLWVVTYLVGLWLLDGLRWFHFPLSTGGASSTSWLTGLHPFLALRVIFNDPGYMPPNLAELPEEYRYWPVSWYLTSPASFYITLMFVLSLVLVLPSIALLRRVAQSTVNLRTWVLTKLKLSKGNQTRKPRMVWNNPIAWREAKTKASAARASVLRYGFMGLGVLGALALLIMYANQGKADQYVRRTSWDGQNNTLTIIEKGTPKTYVLAPGAPLTIDGQPATFDMINTDLAVKQLQGTTKRLNAVDLVDPPRTISAADARKLLLGATVVEFAVILLIVTNAAASTVTREKEDGSLDLLLTTPITSRYYIWGKLRGLVSFVIPLIAVPVVSIVLFIGYDVLRIMGGGTGPAFQWLVFPEAVLVLPGTFVIAAAFAAIVGMQMSLRCRRTVVAVMSSVGIIAGLCSMLGWCGYSFATSASSSGAEAAVAVSSFSPFTVLTLMIDPYGFGGRAFDRASATTSDIRTARMILFFFAWAATGAYAAVVWSMYKSMVKNFDMTIRRQSR